MKTMSTLWSFCALLTLINLANTQQINGATCQLSIDPGNCGVLSVLSTPTLRYGYDRASGRCIQFTYSGCGGNTNRFTSYNQCLTSCFSSQQLSLNNFLNLVGYVLTGQSSINSLVGTPTCNNTVDADITDIKDDDSDAEDGFGLDLNDGPDICDLPIDEGDCRNESLDTNEDGDSDSDNGIDELDELYELNDLNELINPDESNEHNESNESNTFYFGYNMNTKKCEQFNYSGCGGNDNRFDTVNECRKACYTALKNFLAKVTDLLVIRVTNGTYELPAT